MIGLLQLLRGIMIMGDRSEFTYFNIERAVEVCSGALGEQFEGAYLEMVSRGLYDTALAHKKSSARIRNNEARLHVYLQGPPHYTVGFEIRSPRKKSSTEEQKRQMSEIENLLRGEGFPIHQNSKKKR